MCRNNIYGNLLQLSAYNNTIIFNLTDGGDVLTLTNVTEFKNYY